MGSMSRRDFLGTAALFGGAASMLRIIPGAWISAANAASKGFFQTEFGISDEDLDLLLREKFPTTIVVPGSADRLLSPDD